MSAARMPLTGPAGALALLGGAGLALAWPSLPAWPVAVAAGMAGVALVARTRRLGLVGVALIGMALAGLHAGHTLSARLPLTSKRIDVEAVGRVASLPRLDARRLVFDLAVEHSDHRPLAGRTARVSWYFDRGSPPPRVLAGERWRFGLRAKAPRGLRNPGAPDSERHALADRLAAAAYVHGGRAERVSAADGLLAWRERTSARVADAVPGGSSRFIRALALGDTRFLTDEDWTLLRANGLTHLIAISGFHVGMVAGAAAILVRGVWWLWPLLGRWLPVRIAAACVGAFAAGAYAAAAGFSLPTIRTLLMIVIVALALGSRRVVTVWQALALAAIGIVVVDPLALLSAGFWLSFAGVAWLAWCLPRDAGGAMRGLVRAQAVASVGLLPLTVLLFGQASTAGPIANLVAVPLWSLVVAPLAVGGVALEGLFPALAGACWRAAAFCFDIAWPLFERLGASPLALWWTAEPHRLAFALALVGAIWLLLPRGTPGRWLGLALWLPLVWPDTQRPAEGGVEVTTIDVGQGLAVLVRTRSHELLYDTGPAQPDGFDAGERAVVPVLRARGVGSDLDMLMLSHADNDHAGGLAAVLSEVPAGQLLAPEGAGVRGATTCRAGRSWVWDGVRFSVLHPPPHFPYLANESSCVVRVESRGGVLLLTGDIGDVIERRLVESDPRAVRADVVFAGHHGSRHSSDPAFVNATGARHVVFSTGHGNRFRHPAREVEARWRAAGAETWNTADAGAITIRLGAGRFELLAERRRRPRMWDATRNPTGTAGLSYRGD